MDTQLPMHISFAQPLWLLGALVCIPLLLLRLWSHLRTARSLPGLVSPRLKDRLITGSSQVQRWVAHIFINLSLALLFTALARPQYGYEEVDVDSEGRNLLIAIDTSRSMLATDLVPNRLVRAKLAAKDIVRALPDDRIALIAFAGRAFLQAPLTVDHDAVDEAIDQLDTEIIPRGGTNLGAAVDVALDSIREAKLEQSALIVFSDGEALEGADEIDAFKTQASAAGLTILSVGVGTERGSIIPEVDDNGKVIPGQFLKDEAGQIVRSRMDPSQLKELASRKAGYIQLGGRESLSSVVDRLLSGIETSREDDQAKIRPIQRFMWPLGAALFFMVAAHLIPLLFRRTRMASSNSRIGARTAIAGVFVFSAASVQASDPIQQGFDAYKDGRYESSIASYENALNEKHSEKAESRIQLGIGAAAYQKGDFEMAANSFGKALVQEDTKLREVAHYNLGNTLFRKGEATISSQKHINPDGLQPMSVGSENVESTIRQWESAIEHYESALGLNPENEDARHNIEIVKKRIEELQEQQKQEQEQQQQQQQEEEKEKEKEEKKEEEEKQKEEQEQEKEEEEKQEDQEDKQDQQQNQQQQDQQQQDQQKPDQPNQEQDPNQDQEQNQDQQNDNQDKEKQPEQQQNQDPGENEQNPENQQGSDNENKDDGQQPPEPEQKEGPEQQPENEQNPGKGNPDQQKQNGEQPNQPPQPEKQEDLDGELKANPNQQQPQQAQPQQAQQANPMDMKENPETGYSPSEARQLLRALNEETEVRPILEKARTENYKNW